jgi:hypothetical protein
VPRENPEIQRKILRARPKTIESAGTR